MASTSHDTAAAIGVWQRSARRVIIASLIGTLATWAVGFVARPLGGVVLGHFEDRVGRRNVRVATLLFSARARHSLAVSCYVLAMILITLTALELAPETSQIDIHGDKHHWAATVLSGGTDRDAQPR